MDNYQIRTKLYDAASLYEGYDPKAEDSYKDCYDGQVYARYIKYGSSCQDVSITLARTLHDHYISAAMHEFLKEYNPKSIVGIMGGHGLLRNDPMFRSVALISKKLTERGKLMISGGGPGAMEATHLGAWMAGRSDEELDDAINMLSQAAPNFKDNRWLSSAFEVMEKYPLGPAAISQERIAAAIDDPKKQELHTTSYRSLGIPTWLYGHEPATPFATHIAKYYTNSIREDQIVSIAIGGLIFSPGSAGTMQEIFQDAAQNHYKTCGECSPMVFLGSEHYSKTVPVYPFLEDLAARGIYKNLRLHLTDSTEEAIETICRF